MHVVGEHLDNILLGRGWREENFPKGLIIAFLSPLMSHYLCRWRIEPGRRSARREGGGRRKTGTKPQRWIWGLVTKDDQMLRESRGSHANRDV